MLKYLFTATFKDGTIYQQNAEDVSVKEPEKRSCFFDIRPDVDKLAFFVLKGDGHEYGVDLRDGHFEKDGVEITLTEKDEHIIGKAGVDSPPDGAFRLVYWREHTHDFEVNAKGNKESKHELVFRMGWQRTVDGKNEQHVLRIS